MKYLTIIGLWLVCACTQPKAFDSASVADAPDGAIQHVEPPCWWTGMKTGLQLLVNGPEISAYDNVAFEGLAGIKVAKVTKADSPNYLFVDLTIGSGAEAGEGWLVFKNEAGDRFKYPYTIGKKAEGGRESFTTADMIYLIFPDRFANGDPSNDDMPGMQEKPDRNVNLGRHGGDIKGMVHSAAGGRPEL